MVDTLEPSTQSDEGTSMSHLNRSTVRYLGQTNYKTQLLKTFNISAQLFGTSVFASFIPTVLADSGGDFSNNLFSDLAPILALFGEQVAKQYMSHSMSWIEDLIFAMAPLGIITAITGAIRVGGPPSLKAIIGRAREGKGVVEVELMSSTSSDVCELWNGDGIARMLGTTDPSPVIEILHFESIDGSGPNEIDAQPLLERRNPYLAEIYDFESGKEAGIFIQSELHHSSANDEISDTTPPNLGVNIGLQQVTVLELRAVALIATFVQLGVLVFAGLSVLSPLNSTLKKDNMPVKLYSFPLMAAGTVALVIGMFLCARIIERSTDETTWTVDNRQANIQPKVAWLQRGTIVNDQQFDSYFIQSQSSRSSVSGIRRLLSYAFPKIWQNTNAGIQINKSRKAKGLTQENLTTLATFVGMCGFVVQFIGLRGMNWSVTIAQLVATAIVTILRAVIRRGLVLDQVKPEKLPTGYELDWTAQKIKNCRDWNVVIRRAGHWPDGSNCSESDADKSCDGLATEVINARCRLGELCKWESQWQTIVIATATSIEAVINYLYASVDVGVTGLADVFEWELVVEVQSGATVPSLPGFELVKMRMLRRWLDGRGWGEWKVDQCMLEAVLGLWMLYHRGHNAQEKLRVIDVGRNIYERWIQRQSEAIMADSSGIIDGKPLRIFGKPSITQFSSDLLVVMSESPLENICGQFILSAFLSDFANQCLKSIGGRVRIRGGQQGMRVSSFGWSNTVLDDLANMVERTGLATSEEAFLSIVPPLDKAAKLPANLDIPEAFSDTAKEIATYLDGRQHKQAKLLLLWLLDTAECDARAHEADGNWKSACEVYLLLCNTYDNIEGGKDYACEAEQFMGLFCERLFIFFHSNSATKDRALSSVLKLVQDTIGDLREMETWMSRLLKWQTKLEGWEKGIDGFIDTYGENKERLHSALEGGNCLVVARMLNLQNVDVDTSDSTGRTPLILATIAGHESVVSQLLARKAKSETRDHLGRTAMHYASMNGYTSILHILLRYSQTHDGFAIQDAHGKYPIDLAIENGKGSAVSVFIFYGGDCDALPTAARSGNESAAQLLLQNGASIETKVGADGWTALHLAAGNGQEHTVGLLLDYGASVQTKSSKYGRTALHLAAHNGFEATVRLLLDRYANVQAKDLGSWTALHLAAQNGHDATVQLLFDRGANIQANSSGEGRTPLHLAAQSGHETTVQLLLDHGANIHAEGTSNRRTALHLAALNGYKATVQILLDRGASIRATGIGGWTALHLAAQNGHDTTVELLIDRGANIQAKSTFNRRTALHLAAMKGCVTTVQLLLDCGATIHTKSSADGRTALHLAAQNGHLATVRLLLDRGSSFEATDSIGDQTALDLAAQSGHELVIELLRSRATTDS